MLNNSPEDIPFVEEQQQWVDVLPLKGMTLFPGVMAPVFVSRKHTRQLAKQAAEQKKPLVLLCQKDSSIQEPKPADLYDIGTEVRIMDILSLDDEKLAVIVKGMRRVRAIDFAEDGNTIRAMIEEAKEIIPDKETTETVALATNLKEQATHILSKVPNLPHSAIESIKLINDLPILINFISGNLSLGTENKQTLLAIDSILDRGYKLLEILNKEVEMTQMRDDIMSKVQKNIDKQQREYFLNKQMETIRRELGDTGAETIRDMQTRAEQMNWPETAKQTFERELSKLQRMHYESGEYTMQQNYLETLLALPWNTMTEDNYDMQHAKKVLDDDHYGIDKVKERIIEYLAVQRQLALRSDKEKKAHPVTSPILCLYGAPGVGKTSLGRSIAEALGRKYARISLGGLHDESEIRGHRRTYIGALPGRIIENLRKVNSSNPVFVLDEIDKIGADYKGDPTSALLEVLDPEQNNTFHDNYLDMDYDLSHVLFIATANSLDSIPRPLLDRMELIEMTGYLTEEKVQIAKRHLIPKELANHGIKSTQLKFKNAILERIIESYTRESGVRSLDRQIATICRKIDTKLALNEEYNISVTEEDLIDYLGQPRFSREMYETNKYIGVVTGLAWTQVGGEILFIETSLSHSKTPTLTITGNLGDVMKESATIALGYIKSHAKQLGINPKDIESQSVHLHVPEGAIPKDGPSAGITMTTALVSAFTHRKVRARIAMTGEMTLRGKVLPIGGVKEKILAAKRAGITDLILCEDNRKDVTAIPEVYLKGLRFHYVKDIDEVLQFALL